MRLDHLRRNAHIHGSDGFVRVLGSALGLVDPGFFGQVFLAERFGYKVMSRLARLIGNARGVGAHVGDQRGKPLVAQFHALIQALGDIHGALGRVGKALIGRLLQGGGDERRLRGPLALLFFNAFHHERLALERGFQRVRRFPGWRSPPFFR